jgi:hypothetical protein
MHRNRGGLLRWIREETPVVHRLQLPVTIHQARLLECSFEEQVVLHSSPASCCYRWPAVAADRGRGIGHLRACFPVLTARFRWRLPNRPQAAEPLVGPAEHRPRRAPTARRSCGSGLATSADGNPRARMRSTPNARPSVLMTKIGFPPISVFTEGRQRKRRPIVTRAWISGASNIQAPRACTTARPR